MRKKIKFIAFFILCIIIFFTKSVLAAKSTDIGYPLVTVDANVGVEARDTEAKAQELLAEYGYDGEMKDEMRWKATISFCTNSKLYNDTRTGCQGERNADEGPWKILINNVYYTKKWNYKEAKEKFACEIDEPTVENVKKAIKQNNQGKDYTARDDLVKIISYDAVIIAKKNSRNLAISNDAVGIEKPDIKIYIDSIYTGSDMNEGHNIVLSDINTQVISLHGTEEPAKAGKKKKKNDHKILTKIAIMLIEHARTFFGDGPQMLLDSIQTTQYGTGISKFMPWRITYERDEYMQDVNKNNYINFSPDGSNEGSDGQKSYEVLAADTGFDKDTLIPLIPVDLYALATGNVSALDINFLTGQNNTTLHPPDSIWTILRNLIAGVIRATIYTGALVLLLSLIWHGIQLVKHSLTPNEEKKHKEVINSFVVSVVLLVGSVVIMALCIFVSNIAFEDMKVTDTMELPIRIVLVKDGNKIYSFSTNIIGYVRYLTETKQADALLEKLIYTIAYIAFVKINILATLIMLVRMVFIVVLSILGPIIAVAYSLKKNSVLNITYKKWAILYILCSSIQLVYAIVYRIILEIAF